MYRWFRFFAIEDQKIDAITVKATETTRPVKDITVEGRTTDDITVYSTRKSRSIVKITGEGRRCMILQLSSSQTVTGGAWSSTRGKILNSI